MCLQITPEALIFFFAFFAQAADLNQIGNHSISE
jgi:hypothetical protein